MPVEKTAGFVIMEKDDKSNMKVYSIIITLLFVCLVAMQVVLYIEKKNNVAERIAILADFEGTDNKFELLYNKNGDLIFSAIANHSIPKLIYSDYYGSIKVKKYKWLDQNTIKIETRNSNIQINIHGCYIDYKQN